MSIRERVIIDSSQYFVRMITARFFIFFGSMLVARLLGPEHYGFWRALQIVLIYSFSASWGLVEGLNREIPYFSGKNDLQQVNRLRNGGLTMVGLNSILLFAVSAAVVYIVSPGFPKNYVSAMYLVPFVILFQQIYQYYEILYRTSSNFTILSKMRLWRNIIDIFLAVIFVYYINITGRVFANLLAFAILIYFVYRKKDFQLHYLFDFKQTWEILKVGFPIMLIGFIFTLMTTVDRFMIAKYLGNTELGYFGIGLMATGFVYLGPLVIHEVLYPRFNERYGETQDVMALKGMVLEPTIILAYLFPIMLGSLYLLIPAGVTFVLPAYVPGILTAQVMVLGIIFISLTVSLGNFLNTIGQQKTNLLLQVFALAVAVVADYSVIKVGWGIVGVAAATGITYLIYLIILSIFVFVKYFGGWLEHMKFLFQMLFPIAFSVSVLLLLDLIFAGEVAMSMSYFVNLTAKVILFFAASIMLLYMTNKRSGILANIVQILKAKIAKKQA
ncbi:MAG: oligosaccharide flippase family protein [bacterium]